MLQDRKSPPGPHGRRFPTTHWSLILAAGDSRDPDSRRSLEALCRLYWPAVYWYVRRTGSDVETASDLTQGFFARLLEKRDLRQADRARGRFRSFLLTSVKHYLANERDRERALRRGGGKSLFPLDIEDAEQMYGSTLADLHTPETIYEKRWAHALLEQALTRLEEEMARTKHVRHFERFRPFLTLEGGDVSYRDLAHAMGASEASVKVAIHRMRRQFGALLRAEVARTLDDPSAADVDDEIRHLFSVMGI
jgi:RNA polymerase sigma factor (sigma-70 family)